MSDSDIKWGYKGNFGKKDPPAIVALFLGGPIDLRTQILSRFVQRYLVAVRDQDKVNSLGYCYRNAVYEGAELCTNSVITREGRMSEEKRYYFLEDKIIPGKAIVFSTEKGIKERDDKDRYEIIAPIPSPDTCKAIADGSKVVVDADKLLMLIDHSNSTPKRWLKKHENVLSSSFPYDTFMSYFDDIENKLTQQSEGGTDG